MATQIQDEPFVQPKLYSPMWEGVKTGTKSLFTRGLVNGLIGIVAGVVVGGIAIGLAHYFGGGATAFLGGTSATSFLTYIGGAMGIFAAVTTGLFGGIEEAKIKSMENAKTRYGADLLNAQAKMVGTEPLLAAIQKAEGQEQNTPDFVKKLLERGKSNPIEQARKVVTGNAPNR